MDVYDDKHTLPFCLPNIFSIIRQRLSVYRKVYFGPDNSTGRVEFVLGSAMMSVRTAFNTPPPWMFLSFLIAS